MVNSVSTLGGFPHILTSHIFTLGSPHVHWISTHSTHNCETTNHYSARVRTPPKTPPTGSTHTHTRLPQCTVHSARKALHCGIGHFCLVRHLKPGAWAQTRAAGGSLLPPTSYSCVGLGLGTCAGTSFQTTAQGTPGFGLRITALEHERHGLGKYICTVML